MKTVPKTIVITAGDHFVMHLLRGLIRSLEVFPERSQIDIGCLNLGQTVEDRAWLADHGVILAELMPHWDVEIRQLRPYDMAVIARPFLREYFPGYDIYLWIDSDVWLQGWWVIEGFCQGAVKSGLAIAHERERAYVYQLWLHAWFAKHMLLGYGVANAAWLLSRPHLNAGLFAMRADAPHWDLWMEAYRRAWKRTGKFTPHDQFSLNQVVYGRPLSHPIEAALLPTRYNWICNRGQPMWNDEEEVLCEPYAPYRSIGAVHLAGPGKTTDYEVRRTGGGSFKARLVQGVRPPK